MTTFSGQALAAALLVSGSLVCLAASATQRLSGLLLLGPTCSGPEREGQSCPSAPYPDMTVQLRGDTGAVVSQAVTDGRGQFVISAPPGRYRLMVMAPKVTRCPSPEVELPSRAVEPLVIDCDSGRR